jgi:hypothetical protein
MAICRCINDEAAARRCTGLRRAYSSRELAHRLNKYRGTNRICIALFCIFAFIPPARGGTLTTLDGNTFEGSITFDPNDTLLVTPHTGPKQAVLLSNVLRADFIPENRPLLRGVVLTSGEAIAADSITRLDSSGVRIVRSGGIAVTISADDLAIVYFRPLTAEMIKHLPPGRAGAVLDNGDFFEGDPSAFDGNQVKISSVLFGIQSFDVSRQARAVVFQGAQPPDARKIVALVDGSVLLGSSATVSNGRLTIDDARLGSLTLEARLIAHISVGESALDSLSKLPPTKSDGPPGGFAIDATTSGVPMTLLGVKAAHGIGELPGASITWNLGGQYKSVITKAGVPLGIAPIQRLQFIVLTDGREVFRSTPRSSVDDPVAITLSLSGVNLLTLRVEGPNALAPGAAGFWADPILIRDKESR